MALMSILKLSALGPVTSNLFSTLKPFWQALLKRYDYSVFDGSLFNFADFRF
jgi:hypothetical protein